MQTRPRPLAPGLCGLEAYQKQSQERIGRGHAPSETQKAFITRTIFTGMARLWLNWPLGRHVAGTQLRCARRYFNILTAFFLESPFSDGTTGA